MTLNIKQAGSKKSSGKASPIPQEGVQLGVIIQVVDLGVQPGGFYKGAEKPASRKIRLTYELPYELHDFDGEKKPLLISEEFKFSGSELSTCYKRINSIDPGLKKTGGDFAKLVGEAVQVQIVHEVPTSGKYEGRTFANVAAVSPLMRGMSGPDETFNPQYFYSPDSHDENIWSEMPDFLKEKINTRLDATDKPVRASTPRPNPTPQGGDDDEPPFDPGVSTADYADEEW